MQGNRKKNKKRAAGAGLYWVSRCFNLETLAKSAQAAIVLALQAALQDDA
jgi:hypothetical protein